MATYQDIIDGAMAKSTKNQPGVIASPTELRNQIDRIMQGTYAFAAVINPTRLADSLVVVGSGGVWTRPEAAEAIVAITAGPGATLPTGTPISVVPFDDQLADAPRTSVYEFSENFTASGNQSVPPADTDPFTFWFARRPTLHDTATDLDDAVDPVDPTANPGVSRWPSAYTELLILELAIYLSRKDGRMDEVGMFAPERDTWAHRFASWLQRGTPIERKRFAQRHVHNVDTLIPLIGGGA